MLHSLQSRYIYNNVYRYWNHVEQLKKFAQSDKPLIIYDFDGFTTAQITPLIFQEYNNAPYPIPIIDIRSIKKYNALKLECFYEHIYDQICSDISNKILRELRFSKEYYSEILSCIQKINPFQKIAFSASEYIFLILEISDQFYVYNLSRKDLEDIIYCHFPIAELNQILRDNSHYNFAIISSYTNLPSVKKELQKRLPENALVLDTKTNDFPKIWQQKQNKRFSLFGQYLDQISFFVKKGGEELKIQIPDQVCYEGEQEIIVYGEYYKNGKFERKFALSQQEVTLPFLLNSEPFIDGETHLEQAYRIFNQDFESNPNSNIEIRFCLKPGLIPKLEVINSNGNILDITLVDRPQTRISTPSTLGYIPMEQIRNHRQEQSQKAIEKLTTLSLDQDFSFLSIKLSELIQPSSSLSVTSLLSIAKDFSDFRTLWNNQINPNKRSSNKMFFLVLPENNSYVDSYFLSYRLIEKGMATLFRGFRENLLSIETTQSRQKTKPKKWHSLSQAYDSLLLVLGDSYALADKINLDFLFDCKYLSQPKAKIIKWDQHLKMLAKISSAKKRQVLYFDLFRQYAQYRNKIFYKTSEYIWGYARVLMWYLDFDDSCFKKVCSEHFSLITQYCLSLDAVQDEVYIRDALISLIYLLTFREIDDQFVQKDSDIYVCAKKLCQKLQLNPLQSKKANINDMSLNQFFDKLLDGMATQEEIVGMVEIE